MEAAITTVGGYGLAAIGLAASAVGLRARLELSRAKHRSLGGHTRIARLVAALVPFYEYNEAQIFKADGAPNTVVSQRRGDFTRLADLYRERYAGTLQLTAEATELISDLQFCSSISGGSRAGCRASPSLRPKDCRPNTPSNWCSSLSSAIVGRRTTSHGSCAELFGCSRKRAPCDRQKVLKVVPILAWLPDPITRCCSLRRTDWESVPVHSIENVHRCQGSRRQLALSADRHHSKGVFLCAFTTIVRPMRT